MCVSQLTGMFMSTSSSQKDYLIIELNGFNADLLKTATQTHNLPALKKILSFNQTHYKTFDRSNTGYLELWVQWVSIHTGVPSTKHKIKTLNECPPETYPQCWEILSDHHITTGVWGAPNANRRDKADVLFFCPHFQEASQKAYPLSLNPRVQTFQSLAQDHRPLSMSQRLSLFISGHFKALFPSFKMSYKRWTLADSLSTECFIEQKLKFKPRCSFLFLNSLAQLQNHYWTKEPETLTPELLYGLKNLDKIFQRLFDTFPQDEFIVHNGCTHVNTSHEKAKDRAKDREKARKKDSVPKKTSRTIPMGMIFSQTLKFPDHIFNHAFNQTLFHEILPEIYPDDPLFPIEKKPMDELDEFDEEDEIDEAEISHTP